MAEKTITTNIEDENGVEASASRSRFRLLNEEEVTRWSQAIHMVCSNAWVPELRAAFAHLMPFVDEGCPTAYTDCQYRVGVSPTLLDAEKTSIEQLATIILHETMHNTQHHRQRFLNSSINNGKMVNFATDLEINSIIAEGVFDIDLSRGPRPGNGHWDYLPGEYRQIADEKEAADFNARIATAGSTSTVQVGDWFYTGALLPEYADFEDLAANLTAEQYLSYFEVEEETMSLQDFMKQHGSGSSNDDNDDDGNDGNGASGSGNNDENDADDAASNGGGSSTGNGTDAGDNASSNDGSNSGSNSGSGSGSNDDGGMTSDGCGGIADTSIDGEVTVTHIYKTGPNGTRVEVGKDAFVDRIDVSPNSDMWDEISKMGVDPISRTEEQAVRDQVAHDIENSRRSNGYGSHSGNMLLNYVEKGLRPPVVNWKSALRRAVNRASENVRKGNQDFSYTRRSKRYSRGRYIFPGLVSYVPKIRLAIDTSGSMSTNEYKNALSEAEGIIREANGTIEFVCVDAVASDVRKIRSVKDITDEMVGGGGTDMSAAVKQVCEAKPKDRPDVLIIATDGCYDWHGFAESLAAPEMSKTIPIVVVVYKFTEDTYFAKEGEFRNYQELCRKYNKDAKVLQAWVK